MEKAIPGQESAVRWVNERMMTEEELAMLLPLWRKLLAL
jgi:hypothetical protein